jgi:hypothetical protein
VVTEPFELTRARAVTGLCEKFGCLPSALYEEDAEVFRMMKIVELGTPPQGGGDEVA